MHFYFFFIGPANVLRKYGKKVGHMGPSSHHDVCIRKNWQQYRKEK